MTAGENENSSALPAEGALLSVRGVLSLWRERIAAVAVGTLDLAVHPVDDKLSFLVLTDFSSSIDGLFFRVVVPAGALCAASLYIPTTVRVGNNVMSRSCHCLYPL